MNFADFLTVAFVLIGAFFATLAGVGIIRMPDLYTRMQSATKAGTLGVACIAAAAVAHFQTVSSLIEGSLIIVFLFATAPVASHLIARSAFVAGTPLWTRTTLDADVAPNSDSPEPSASTGEEAPAQS
ncbi:MAG: monovalent cation/H(+) antiporter subunit G [Planctomycetota bacterium]